MRFQWTCALLSKSAHGFTFLQRHIKWGFRCKYVNRLGAQTEHLQPLYMRQFIQVPITPSHLTTIHQLIVSIHHNTFLAAAIAHAQETTGWDSGALGRACCRRRRSAPLRWERRRRSRARSAASAVARSRKPHSAISAPTASCRRNADMTYSVSSSGCSGLVDERAGRANGCDSRIQPCRSLQFLASRALQPRQACVMPALSFTALGHCQGCLTLQCTRRCKGMHCCVCRVTWCRAPLADCCC